MSRKVATVAVAGLGLLVALWWFLREAPPAAPEVRPARELSSALRDRAAAPPDRSELRAAGSADVGGRILDGDGQPVGGALLSLFALAEASADEGAACVCADACGEKLFAGECPEGTELLLSRILAAPGPLARTLSGDDGRYTLRGLEPGRRYRVWVESERGVAAAEVSGGDREGEIVLGAGWSLRGTVVGTDHKPVPGAAVAALDVRRGRVYDGVSDARGAFTLGPLAEGPHAVVAAHGELQPARLLLDETKAPEALVLHTLHTGTIRVLRGEQPVQGAKVTVERWHRTETLLTSERGEVVVERLRPTGYPVTAHDGALTAAGTLSVRFDGTDPLVLRLAPSASLTVQVRSAAGEPVRGANLVVRVDTPGTDARFEKDLAEDGRAVFEALPAGEAKLTVTAPGYLNRSEESVLLVAGQPATHELILSAAEAVTGVVVDADGRAIRERVVVSGHAGGHGDTVAIEADGRFRLFLGKGRGELEIDHPSYRPLRKQIVTPATDVRLVLERGLTLQGKVLEVDGTPAVGARVASFRDPAARSAEDRATLTDAKGEFTLAGLQAGALVVFAAAETRAGEAQSYRVAGEQVTVPTSSPLLLRLKGGERMEGRVVDQHGAPAPAVDVRAELEGVRDADAQQILQALQGGTPFGMATTDAEGRFQIETLRPGTYDVHLAGDRYQTTEVKASPGKPVRLVVQRRPLVRGRVLDAAGAVATRFQINHRSYSPADGRFEHPIPETDNHQLRFELADHAPLLKGVNAAAGRDVNLGDVRLQRGRVISGRVVDAATGAAIAGAQVDFGAADVSPTRARLGSEKGAVRTDAGGRFELRHVPEDRALALFATHPDYTPGKAPLGQDAQIALQRGAVIRGTIAQLPQGAFVRLYVTGPMTVDATPDGAGNFRMSGLPGGEYQLRVAGPLAKSFDVTKLKLADGEERIVELRPRAGLHTVTLELTGAPATFSGLLDANAPTDAQALRRLKRERRWEDAVEGVLTFEAVDGGRRRVLLSRETPEGLYVATLELEVTEDTKVRLPYPPEQRFAVSDLRANDHR